MKSSFFEVAKFMYLYVVNSIEEKSNIINLTIKITKNKVESRFVDVQAVI